MKTVKILIEVCVPEWTTHVAVDGDGSIYGYGRKPYQSDYSSYWDTHGNVLSRRFNDIEDVINWRETLTEVKE